MAAAVLSLYFVWAALHDIARGGESDYTLEYVFLALGVLALVFIHRMLLRMFTPNGRRVWRWVAIGVLLIVDAGALASRMNPKFPNDVVVGTAVLAATLPLLGLLVFQSICPCCQSRSGCRS